MKKPTTARTSVKAHARSRSSMGGAPANSGRRSMVSNAMTSTVGWAKGETDNLLELEYKEEIFQYMKQMEVSKMNGCIRCFPSVFPSLPFNPPITTRSIVCAATMHGRVAFFTKCTVRVLTPSLPLSLLISLSRSSFFFPPDNFVPDSAEMIGILPTTTIMATHTTISYHRKRPWPSLTIWISNPSSHGS